MKHERYFAQREVPAEPHPDLEGRAGYILANYPSHGATRLAADLYHVNGYIRGERASALYSALKPYFAKREQKREQNGNLVVKGVQ